MSAARPQSSVHSASELIECNYTPSPKEPCHLPVTDIQINGEACWVCTVSLQVRIFASSIVILAKFMSDSRDMISDVAE